MNDVILGGAKETRTQHSAGTRKGAAAPSGCSDTKPYRAAERTPLASGEISTRRLGNRRGGARGSSSPGKFPDPNSRLRSRIYRSPQSARLAEIARVAEPGSHKRIPFPALERPRRGAAPATIPEDGTCRVPATRSVGE